MIVTFCGHRDFDDADTTIRLYIQIENLINMGIREFYLGGYGNFDYFAALALNTYKKLCPDLKRRLITPYSYKPYNHNLYDSSIYPPLKNIPKKYAIIKRNQWMVENSDIIISYVRRFDNSGAAKTLKYAENLGKNIIRL